MFAKKSKEYSNLGGIISTAKEYLNFEEEKRGLEQILNDKNNDMEIIEMAKKVDYSVEERLRALYDLQLIDSRIDKLRSVRGELPLEVQDLEDEVAGLEVRVEKVNGEIVDLENQILKIVLKKLEK